MNCSNPIRPFIGLAALLALCSTEAADSETVRIHLTISSRLTYPRTPCEPRIDLSDFIHQAGLTGFPDYASLSLTDLITGTAVPYVLSEEFRTGDAGRIAFVIDHPAHTRFAIDFRVCRNPRPPPVPDQTPLIGIGDLLRYNAGKPRPIAVPYSACLRDLNGDGQLDLAGTWNYARRPGRDRDSVICFPRTTHGRAPSDGQMPSWHFGNLHRLHFHDPDSGQEVTRNRIYLGVDFGDLNGDGLPDAVVTHRGSGRARLCLNQGAADRSGMPTFTVQATVPVSGWQTVRLTDLNGDAATDLVVDGEYIENQNAEGWPFVPGPAVFLDAGRHPCFLDVTGDGRPDAVCLEHTPETPAGFFRLCWRRHLGTAVPSFGALQPLTGIDVSEISQVSSWENGSRRGLLVQHTAYQQVSIFELAGVDAAGRPRFTRCGRAESAAAQLALGDQAWPCLCDWDDDGDVDLLAGGGHGWLRIVINEGTRQNPVFGEPQRIQAAGRPIRLLRNELLGPPEHPHNMGYPYPVFADWDADGRPDLVVPNETNRLYWYRNIGTRQQPQFAERRQILCDGFPDSAEMKSRSNRRANDAESNNGAYPYENERPFFWRTGAAVADFTGDGLADLITLDGQTRSAVLFEQYRGEGGVLRLRKGSILRLTDGRPITDRIVDRRARWTESFRPVDWDQDGRLDLIYSVAGSHDATKDGGSIYLLRNEGTLTALVFAPPRTMRCFGEPIRISDHGPHPWAGDLDGDGLPDLVACTEWSVYPWYSHAALMMPQHPEYTLRLQPAP